MSVTFYPELGKISHYKIVCVNCDASETHDTYDVARDINSDIRLGVRTVDGCVEEDEYCQDSAFVESVDVLGELPEVNVSNTNARYILEILGIGGSKEDAFGDYPLDDDRLLNEEQAFEEYEDLCGDRAAEDFLGRVLMGLAVAPVSAEVPAHAVGVPNFIDCGREEGYAQDVLNRLYVVAEFAQKNNRRVVWC